MFSRETLAGILLAKGQFFCNVQVDEKMRIGYSVKLGIDIRMDSYKFLRGVKRTLLQYGVRCTLKGKESAKRNRPILTIRRITDLNKVAKIYSSIIPHPTDGPLNHDESLK